MATLSNWDTSNIKPMPDEPNQPNDPENWDVSKAVGVPEQWFQDIPTLTEEDMLDWDTENVSDMSELGQALTYVHHSADGSVVYCRNGQELRRARFYDTVWVLSPGLIYLTVGIGMAYLANLF